MTTALALVLVAVVAYVLGKRRGFVLAIRYVASLFPDTPAESDFIAQQREQAKWQ